MRTPNSQGFVGLAKPTMKPLLNGTAYAAVPMGL